ncbi:hypothetical protein F511_38097 [Dorcoceras hygrometricum]|uniref:Uncharacterized protein n=1 Tax=Dorcoceras hygrometricum TaxID=472368 RepID=A0A2Z7A7P9_9LAMI|nr:hypothetical protein F511_38097 [Dorcoceras hygrometricum]
MGATSFSVSDLMSRSGVVLRSVLVSDVNPEVVGGCCSPDLNRFELYLREDFDPSSSIVPRRLEIFPVSKLCRDTLATVHRTLSSPIADGSQICVARDFVVVIVAQKIKLLSVLGFDRMSLWGWCLFACVCCPGFPGYSAGRGVDPAGGVPGGG